LLQEIGGACGFQRGGEESVGAEAFGAEGLDQGVYRVGVGGGEVAAVERDRDVAGLGFGDDAALGVVPAAVGDGLVAHDGARVKACGEGELCEGGLGGDGPACIAKGGKAAQRRGGQGGIGVKGCIFAAIGGEDGEGYAMAAGVVLQLHQPIGPVILAADQADEDAFDASQGLLDIGVDRKRMFERHQIGEAQGGEFPPCPVLRAVPARRESAQVTV
jgi:hypothetical protein